MEHSLESANGWERTLGQCLRFRHWLLFLFAFVGSLLLGLCRLAAGVLFRHAEFFGSLYEADRAGMWL